jgi:hypothetical protein
MSRTLKVDCCWVQVIDLGSHKLSLSAYHGFTPLILEKMTDMDLNHSFVEETSGIGSPSVIQDLKLDGRFGMSFFAKEGFRSLVAVPIFTYRIIGILGTAFRVKKRFDKDYIDLLVAIAGIVGVVHDKCAFLKDAYSNNEQASDKSLLLGIHPHNFNLENAETSGLEDITKNKQRTKPGSREHFKKHQYNMNQFRNSHRINIDRS